VIESQEPRQLPVGANIDPPTIRGFGQEWTAYDQTKLTGRSYEQAFEAYFRIFPFEQLSADAEGFDLGCGSGRWAAEVAPRVGLLHCIDPSEAALQISRWQLRGLTNVRFHLASSDTIPLADSSQDFGYSLGVLHHVPDTASALGDAVRKLKVGAPFLVYIYYAMENRPRWYRSLWRASELARHLISRTPFGLRKGITTLIALSVYWPLARTAAIGERMGVNVKNFPLAIYRRQCLYTMRTDALDRFGTRLEQRFTRDQIKEMMEAAGLADIEFSEQMPFWVAVGHRSLKRP
jgi:ubiquinone/menaquinone biosynthesis C-methylase UbiE